MYRKIYQILEETGKFGETYVMMYALETLHNRGITVKETVYESIHNLNQWYEQSGNYKYLELALLHMQAYANMGFALDEADLSVQKVLEYTCLLYTSPSPRDTR